MPHVQALACQRFLHKLLYLNDVCRTQYPRHACDVLSMILTAMFSETHVLSLLYAGELCYWHIKHNKPQDDTSQSSQSDDAEATATEDNTQPEAEGAVTSSAKDEPKPPNIAIASPDVAAFSAKECGSRLLQLYLDVVEGPLKNHGWMLERANELLAYIEKSDESGATKDS